MVLLVFAGGLLEIPRVAPSALKDGGANDNDMRISTSGIIKEKPAISGLKRDSDPINSGQVAPVVGHLAL
jgi:hypothetical protein